MLFYMIQIHHPPTFILTFIVVQYVHTYTDTDLWSLPRIQHVLKQTMYIVFVCVWWWQVSCHRNWNIIASCLYCTFIKDKWYYICTVHSDGVMTTLFVCMCMRVCVCVCVCVQIIGWRQSSIYYGIRCGDETFHPKIQYHTKYEKCLPLK